MVMQFIAISYYVERDYARAVDEARLAATRYPEFPLIHRWLAAALGQLGRTEEARMACIRRSNCRGNRSIFMCLAGPRGAVQRNTSTCSKVCGKLAGKADALVFCRRGPIIAASRKPAAAHHLSHLPALWW